MTTRSRPRLAGVALALTLAAGLTAAGPASADLPLPVDTPPLPVDTTCLNGTTVTDILQCTVSTVGGTVTTITSQIPPLPPNPGMTGTSTTIYGWGSTPYAVGGTTQQGTPRSSQRLKRHYRKHRSGHRHRYGSR